MTGLRAITVRQPHAAAIAAGVKQVENRGRGVHLRGEIAIHAGLQVDANAGLAFPATHPIHRYGRRGAILALAEIVGCHLAVTDSTNTVCCQAVGGTSAYNWRAAHHLVLANVRPLPTAVPARGFLQIGWQVLPAAEAAVRAQFASVTVLPHPKPEEV